MKRRRELTARPVLPLPALQWIATMPLGSRAIKVTTSRTNLKINEIGPGLWSIIGKYASFIPDPSYSLLIST